MTTVRQIPVGAAGELPGLTVVGFHGHVDPAHTPARREAVLVDGERRLVCIERVDVVEAAGQLPPSVWVRAGQPLDQDASLPGEATPLGPLPAHLGSVVVVLGAAERAAAARLVEVEDRHEVRGVGAFVRWLDERAPLSEELLAQRLGDMVVWYCRLEQAEALFERIRHVATEELVRAASLGDSPRLYSSSWWLSRAALDDADIYLAAAGLERSGDAGAADALLRAAFRKRAREQIEDGLARPARRDEQPLH